MKHEQGVEAEFAQGFAGDSRRDKRVTVTIASNPSPEAQAWAGLGCTEEFRREAEFVPGPAEAHVELGDDLWQDIPQVEHEGPSLVGHVRLIKEDLTAPPEALEADLDLAADFEALARGQILSVEFGEELVDRAVLVQNCAALRLGRVGGEDRLHAHSRQVGGDLLRGPSLGGKTGELVPPEPPFVGESLVNLPQAPGPGGGIRLDDIEKLERDRVGLLQPPGTAGSRLIPVEPW